MSDIEEIKDLDKYEEDIKREEEEKAQQKKQQQNILDTFLTSSEKKREKMMNEMNEVDAKVKTVMSMILNYYASHGQFNQELLEEVVPLIGIRHKIMKKLR